MEGTGAVSNSFICKRPSQKLRKSFSSYPYPFTSLMESTRLSGKIAIFIEEFNQPDTSYWQTTWNRSSVLCPNPCFVNMPVFLLLLMQILTSQVSVSAFAARPVSKRSCFQASQVPNVVGPALGRSFLFGSQNAQSIIPRFPLSKSSSNNKNEKEIFYSDDCFGLIFLSTGLIAKDVVFAACFVLLSGLAAYSFNTYSSFNEKGYSKSRLQKQFPAAVAGLTLLFFAPITRVIIQPSEISFLPERMSIAPILEIGVCAVSVIYSLVRSREE